MVAIDRWSLYTGGFRRQVLAIGSGCYRQVVAIGRWLLYRGGCYRHMVATGMWLLIKDRCLL